MNLVKKMMAIAKGGEAPGPGPTCDDSIYFNKDNSNELHLSTPAFPADSKQFTLNFWLKNDELGAGGDIYILEDGSQDTSADRWLCKFGTDATNGIYLLVTFVVGSVTKVRLYSDYIQSNPSQKWHHFIVSVDLNALTGTMYVNDILQTGVASSIFVNQILPFSGIDELSVNNFYNQVSPAYWRSLSLQHIYLITGEYLDLSTESNRRKFSEFNDEGQLVPVDLGATGSTPTGTQPEIYLPLTDSADVGNNVGSLGDFTENGAFDAASASPCTPSVESIHYNNTDAYLKHNSGFADSSRFTVSFWYNNNGLGANNIFCFGSDTYVWITTSGLSFSSTRGSLVVSVPTPASGWHHYCLTVDAGYATPIFAVYIDDVAATVTGNTLTTGNFDNTQALVIGAYNAGTPSFYNNAFSISELYMSNLYVDFSIEATRREYINADLTPANTRQLHINATVTPTVYLPHSAQEAGSNEGTAGDFTINGTIKNALSTPLYYYANPVLFDGTNDYLNAGGAIPASYTLTASFWFKRSASSFQYLIYSNPSSVRIRFANGFTNNLEFTLRDATGSDIIASTVLGALAIDTWHHIVVSVDSQNSLGKYSFDGGTVTNLTISLTTQMGSSSSTEIANSGGGSKANGEIADAFISTDYIDLSVAANLAKFITADGEPAGNLIETTGLTPEIYLANPYDTFEKNLGSGGDFTVTGALTIGTNSPSDRKV